MNLIFVQMKRCIVGDSECDMQLKISTGLQMAIFVDAEGNRPVPKEADWVVRCVTHVTI
jgi:histidinol phosphatase-like enzyme